MNGSPSPDENIHLPSAPLDHLRRRAEILHWVRSFFRSREVLEVETPVLCQAGAVDEHLDPIQVVSRSQRASRRISSLYLVTSPEHSMKRLLASGSGPIYQITRAFRDEERGRLHNPEFTILEWYLPGKDHLALTEQVEDLIRGVFSSVGDWTPAELREEVLRPFERITYRDAFLRALGIDPFRCSVRELALLAARQGASPEITRDEEDRDGLLHLLLATCVETTLGFGRPTFLHDYPPSQAALARVRPADPEVAERFELYVRGVELANGYNELTDPAEQERRFRLANAKREAAGKRVLPIDQLFLRALQAGMPRCAGVAIGLDRVVMLAVGADTIDDVLAFPIERA